MSQRDPKRLTDGTTTVLGGVDNGRTPLLLRADQVASAVNATMRGGFIKSRPGMVRLTLTFSRAEYGEWFTEQLFQGADRYDDFRGREKIVVSVGGRLFCINLWFANLVTEITPRKTALLTAGFTAPSAGATVDVSVDDGSRVWVGLPVYVQDKEFTVTSKPSANVLRLTNREMTVGTAVATGEGLLYLDTNGSTRPQVWTEQAEQYLVVQDGETLPWIYDGSSTRRALLNKEVPVGTVMAYGQGRLWVAVNGKEFTAGDIVGGPTGVLTWSENTYLSGGGNFRVPANTGKIRAMKFIANLDTSLGQGPLQVATEKAVFSVSAPTNRDAWQVVTDPIQTVSLINFGASSQRSTVLVNGDMFFRARDGWRSFIVARRDFGMWGNTPVSREMQSLLGRDTPELLQFGSAVLFDNRLLMTVTPQPSDQMAVRHKGIIALDFDLISTMQGKLPPAYDGVWTGCEPTQLLAGEFGGRERCFAFALSEDGFNELWELSASGEGGMRFDNDRVPIESAVEYRSFQFQSELNLKELTNGEVWVSRIAGQTDLTLMYRPDQHPCWQTWHSTTICATAEDCDTEEGCKAQTQYREGFKTRIGFGTPPDEDNESDEKSMRAGYSFQPRLEWVGFAEINKLMLHGQDVDERGAQPPEDRSDCESLTCCPSNPFDYRPGCWRIQTPVILLQALDTIDLKVWVEAGQSITLRGQTSDGNTDVLFESDGPEESGWQTYEAIELFGGTLLAPPGDWIDLWLEFAGGPCGLTVTGQRVRLVYPG